MCTMANKQIHFKKWYFCGNKVYHFPHILHANLPNKIKRLHVILLLCTPDELRASFQCYSWLQTCCNHLTFLPWFLREMLHSFFPFAFWPFLFPPTGTKLFLKIPVSPSPTGGFWGKQMWLRQMSSVPAYPWVMLYCTCSVPSLSRGPASSSLDTRRFWLDPSTLQDGSSYNLLIAWILWRVLSTAPNQSSLLHHCCGYLNPSHQSSLPKPVQFLPSNRESKQEIPCVVCRGGRRACKSLPRAGSYTTPYQHHHTTAFCASLSSPSTQTHLQRETNQPLKSLPVNYRTIPGGFR